MRISEHANKTDKEDTVGQKTLGAVAVVLFVALLMGVIYMTTGSREGLAFQDISVDRGFEELSARTEGLVTITALSGDQDSAVELVGTIAVREVTDTGATKWSFNPRFRPPREKVSIRPVDELLYRGIVSNTANAQGSLAEVSATLGGENLAEVSIRNQLILSFADPRDVPYAELAAQRLEPGKQYFYIERVIVTDVTARTFRKHDGKTAVTGMAFGANGAIYSSQEEVRALKKISFRPFDIAHLRASEAGVASNLSSRIRRALSNGLKKEEAEALLNDLHEASKPEMPVSVPNAEVPSMLPAAIRDFKPVVWHANVPALRQSTPTSCWAAATAMLFAYKHGRPVSEREAVVGVGTLWSEVYRQANGLLPEYKLRFLTEADLKFVAPQSFHAMGLASLLKKHGPLWFTIDLEEGAHASVLTGMFLSADGEYWVSYIDPSDGDLKADTFNGFMRRYEEPAWRWNEAHQGPVTLDNFYVQVVHL